MGDSDAEVADRANNTANKAVVARAVDQVVNGGDLDAVDELYDPGIAADAKAWVAPFRESFPDVHMDTVALVAEGDTVVGHFRCSGTHVGRWLGQEPTGRRFTDVDEVYWFTLAGGRITAWWGLEDNAARLRQLRLPGPGTAANPDPAPRPWPDHDDHNPDGDRPEAPVASRPASTVPERKVTRSHG